MRGDEMQDEIAPVFRQGLESGLGFRIGQRPEFVPIPIQYRLVYRSERLGERNGEIICLRVTLSPESTLPAQRPLALVMHERGERQRFGGDTGKADLRGDAPGFLLGPALMLAKLLRPGNRTGIL